VELHYVHLGGVYSPSCFSTATGADLLLANGAKFIGSAQLIHGNFTARFNPIGADAALFAQVFGAQSFNQLPIAQGEKL